MLPAGFEPAFPASVQPHTLALNLSATGIERSLLDRLKYTDVG